MNLKLENVASLNARQNQATEHDRAIEAGTDRPDAAWVKGICPECREPLVSNSYYVGGSGYKQILECWASLGASPTCTYRQTI